MSTPRQSRSWTRAAGSRIRSRALDAPFGAELAIDAGADLRAEEGAALRGLFADHGLLVVRGREISREEQIAWVSALGRLEPDASGQPMEMEVTNQHDQSTAPPGELVFHYDYAYDPQPIPAISMYGLRVDGEVTPTCFANSARVLDALSADTLAALEGREAAHACFLSSPERPEERSREPEALIARGEAGWGPLHYWAHHPLLWSNTSGTPTLFACLQHTDRIVGLPRAESDALLAEVYHHLYAEEAVYEHGWLPGDLVIWDNLTVQHARPEPNDRPRTLRRFHVSETDLTLQYLEVGRKHGYV